MRTACRARPVQRRTAGRRSGRHESRAAAEMQPVIERLARSHRRTGRPCGPACGKRRRRTSSSWRWRSRAGFCGASSPSTPRRCTGLVLAALEKLQAQEICRVRVHPAHAEADRRVLAEARAGIRRRSGRRFLRRARRGHLRNQRGQPGRLRRNATSGDRARPGRPPAERKMSDAISHRAVPRRGREPLAVPLDRAGHRSRRPADRIARPERRDRRFLRGAHRQRTHASARR